MWLWFTLRDICCRVFKDYPHGLSLEIDHHVVHVYSDEDTAFVSIRQMEPSNVSRTRERHITTLVAVGTNERIHVTSNVHVYTLHVSDTLKLNLHNITTDNDWVELVCFSLIANRLVRWSNDESIPCSIPPSIGTRPLFLRGMKFVQEPHGFLLLYSTPSRFIVVFLLSELYILTSFDFDLNHFKQHFFHDLLREQELRELTYLHAGLGLPRRRPPRPLIPSNTQPVLEATKTPTIDDAT